VGYDADDPSFTFIPDLNRWMNEGISMLGDQLEKVGVWFQLPMPETGLVITMTTDSSES
jgi:hypothetical protein